MCQQNVGAIPVVMDQQSRSLVGIITDRDLCCSIIAKGLDPKSTAIESYMRANPIACRDGENLDGCERQMQEHQIRRIPVVDGQGSVIGIVSQADLALKDNHPEKVSRTIAEISRPHMAA
jgi:CBS domain-containing protein